ncbi:MAG: hypothetical protein E7215_01580 [Clostridium sulfidigenes]|uniref:Uncharacterized protein n=1 Tax=Clostridium sulfidigenes TaxID=318464 RepID=A0A927WAT8_9CLOT|nr:hypothetical protein [Clostridium sulfidigenes]
MEKKTRGFWTTLMLVLYILGGLNSIIIAIGNKSLAEIVPEAALSSGLIIYSIISGIIFIVISIGIFMWKKVAVYALAVYYPVNFLIGLITMDYSSTPVVIGSIIGGIIGIIITYLIVFSLLKKIKYNEEIENTMNV